MNVDDAIKNRISTRAFTGEPVDEAELRALLELARWSPSGGNCQPWHVYVLSGASMAAFRAETARAMAEDPMGEESEFHIYPPGIKEPYRTRRFECGEALYRAIGIPREDKGGRLMQLARNYDFFGAPAAFFFALDLGPALLELGLGTVPHLDRLVLGDDQQLAGFGLSLGQGLFGLDSQYGAFIARLLPGSPIGIDGDGRADQQSDNEPNDQAYGIHVFRPCFTLRRHPPQGPVFQGRLR